MRNREPRWHKPRAVLVASLAFGTWAMTGAAVFLEPNMVVFGAMCTGLGLGLYGFDCLLNRLVLGTFRPPEVWRTDVRWAGTATVVGSVLGLLAPLYVH